MSSAGNYSRHAISRFGTLVDRSRKTILVAKASAKIAKFGLRHRVKLLALGHAAVFTLSLWLSFLLRFDGDVSSNFVQLFWMTLPGILAIKLYAYLSLIHI